MEEDFHPSYDCSDCAKKAAEDVPENGNAKKKPKMYHGETLGLMVKQWGLPNPVAVGKDCHHFFEKGPLLTCIYSL